MRMRVWRALAALPALLLTLLILAGYAGATVKTGPVGSWVKARASSPPPADVDMDFTTSAAGLTVTRAGTAYVDNLAGTWTSVGANTARQSDKGLLVEESRTNGIRNNSMQGTVVGTPGTLPTNWSQAGAAGTSQQVVGFGTTASGIDYVDIRLFGTMGSANSTRVQFDTATGIAALTGQTWTQSVWLAVVGGSQSNITAFALANWENTSGGAFVKTNSIGISPTATLTRYTYTVALSGGGTTAAIMPYVSFAYNNGVAIDITLRIGWPQAEQGSWATSPIRTTAAAVTRNADSILLASMPTFGPGASLVASGTPQAPSAYATIQGLAAISDGTASNRMLAGRVAGNAWAHIESPANNFDVTLPAWTPAVRGVVGAATTPGSSAAVFNGGTINTSANPTTMFAPTIVEVGKYGAGNWNGFVDRLRIWSTKRLSDSELQRVSQ